VRRADETIRVDALPLDDPPASVKHSGFRSWLIGRGRAAFEAVLENQDALADLPGILDIEHHTDEGYGGVALTAWFDLHDGEPDDAAYAQMHAIENAHLSAEEREYVDGHPGREFPDWRDVPRLYPRLWALVGHRFDPIPRRSTSTGSGH
jgi:hypothetical protein